MTTQLLGAPVTLEQRQAVHRKLLSVRTLPATDVPARLRNEVGYMMVRSNIETKGSQWEE